MLSLESTRKIWFLHLNPALIMQNGLILQQELLLAMNISLTMEEPGYSVHPTIQLILHYG